MTLFLSALTLGYRLLKIVVKKAALNGFQIKPVDALFKLLGLQRFIGCIYFCQKPGALHPAANATIKALTCF